MRHAQGSATPQHHRHGRAMLPDRVHLGPYADDGQGVFLGIDARGVEMILRHTGDGEQEGGENEESFHDKA